MKSSAPPTAEELDRVAVLCAREENRAYFFDRLQNPDWIAPLAKRGFFDDPSGPVPAGEPGYVRFPPWPEGRYLVRMAALAPTQVASILASANISENPVVTRLFLEAAGSLPHTQLRQISQNVREWVTAPYPDHFADEAAVVIVHLLEAGEVSVGLDVIASLLEVQPDPRRVQKAAASDSPLRPTPEAAARFSEWIYERVLEQILGPAVDSAGLDAVRLFASLLDDAMRLGRWEDETSNEADSSYIWRPAIENHDQNLDTGISNDLVSAVRDAALQHASRGEREVEEVFRELQSRSMLHRRIGLYVLAKIEHGANLVAERLAERDLFDDHRVRHEYAGLLRSRFQDAVPSLRQQVLAWIGEGPNLDDYRHRRTEIEGVEPSTEEITRYADLWRRDRYSFVASHLEGTHAERYRNLVEALGEPDHPDFVSWSTSWSGPESPVAEEELQQRSPQEVLEYLGRWRPEDDSGWHFGPSVEGLGHVLSGVVAARADEFATIAGRFRDVDPTYVRALFSGLETALRQGGEFPWEEPLALASWVVRQPFEPDEEVEDRDKDPGWRWSRREIASAIRTGLTEKVNRIPFELRNLVWGIIERLTTDPNPSPDHEARYGGDNMDPLTLSINTNRGTAMHAVVDYALWCRRELETRNEDVSPGFDLMPEVREVLEAHLEPDEESSLAVRAVYGRWLPWLILLDEAWTAEHLAMIFPDEPDGSVFADTAWSTYITWCSPYDSALRTLRKQYEDAVLRVPSDKRAGVFGRVTIDSKLGEHLVTFYWRNLLERDLLDQYFERAGDDIAAQVVDFVGRALRNTTGEVSAPVLRRIESLWEWRFSVARTDPDAHRLELRAFGNWFASGKLNEAWGLAVLERTVELAGAPTLGHLVAERLVAVASRDPVSAARVFARMIERPEREWDYVGWRDEARAVVGLAVASGDPDASEHAREIVDFYVRRGELEFRDLLRGPTS